MSQENVEIVRWGFTSDPARFFSLLHEQVEFDARGAVELPGAVLRGRGREVVERYCREFWGTWAEYSAEPKQFIDADDANVIVEVDEHGKGKGSGVPFAGTHAQVWTIRHGKVVCWRLFADTALALEAVGLSE
jgi:ketosteroid isomerase-like protein